MDKEKKQKNYSFSGPFQSKPASVISESRQSSNKKGSKSQKMKGAGLVVKKEENTMQLIHPSDIQLMAYRQRKETLYPSLDKELVSQIEARIRLAYNKDKVDSSFTDFEHDFVQK